MKSKRGRKPSTHPGPATLKHIEEVYKDLKTNYPYDIFVEIAKEFRPNSRDKRGYTTMNTYFASPENHSIDIWHHIFKAIVAVKARY